MKTQTENEIFMFQLTGLMRERLHPYSCGSNSDLNIKYKIQ